MPMFGQNLGNKQWVSRPAQLAFEWLHPDMFLCIATDMFWRLWPWMTTWVSTARKFPFQDMLEDAPDLSNLIFLWFNDLFAHVGA